MIKQALHCSVKTFFWGFLGSGFDLRFSFGFGFGFSFGFGFGLGLGLGFG